MKQFSKITQLTLLVVVMSLLAIPVFGQATSVKINGIAGKTQDVSGDYSNWYKTDVLTISYTATGSQANRVVVAAPNSSTTNPFPFDINSENGFTSTANVIFDKNIGTATSVNVTVPRGEHYAIAVRSYYGGANAKWTVRYYVHIRHLPPPISAPADKTSVTGNTVAVKWSKVTNATGYRIQWGYSSTIDDNNGLSSPVFDKNVGDVDTYTPDLSNVADSKVVYLAVRGGDATLGGEWKVISFTHKVAVVNQKPTVSFSTANYSEFATSTAKIEGTASDDKVVSKVQYSYDNTNWLDATGTTNWSFNANLVEGSNVLYVKAIDAESLSDVKYIQVTYKKPAPTTFSITVNVNKKGEPIVIGGIEMAGMDLPVENAGVDFAGYKAATNAEGVAVITNIPQGTSGTVKVSSGLESGCTANATNASITSISADKTVDFTVTCTTTPVNIPPDFKAQAFSVQENSPANTLIGTLSYSDVDNDNVTFSIVSQSVSNAVILSNGKLYVNTVSVFDYETRKSFTVDISANDGVNPAVKATITVNITDVNETASTYNITVNVNQHEDGLNVGGIVMEGMSLPVENATVEISGTSYKAVTNAEGIAIIANVPKGTSGTVKVTGGLESTCSATSTNAGITNLSADATVDFDVNCNGTQPLAYNVTFTVKNSSGTVLSGATVTFNGVNQQTGTDGKTTFASVSPANNLAYKVSLTGYETVSNYLNVIDKDVAQDISMKAVPLYNVTFSAKAEDNSALANVSVVFNGKTQITSVDGKTIFSNVASGSNLTFAASLNGYESVNSTLNVVSSDVLKVVVLKKLVNTNNQVTVVYENTTLAGIGNPVLATNGEWYYIVAINPRPTSEFDPTYPDPMETAQLILVNSKGEKIADVETTKSATRPDESDLVLDKSGNLALSYQSVSSESDGYGFYLHYKVLNLSTKTFSVATKNVTQNWYTWPRILIKDNGDLFIYSFGHGGYILLGHSFINNTWNTVGLTDYSNYVGDIIAKENAGVHYIFGRWGFGSQTLSARLYSNNNGAISFEDIASPVQTVCDLDFINNLPYVTYIADNKVYVAHKENGQWIKEVAFADGAQVYFNANLLNRSNGNLVLALKDDKQLVVVEKKQGVWNEIYKHTSLVTGKYPNWSRQPGLFYNAQNQLTVLYNDQTKVYTANLDYVPAPENYAMFNLQSMKVKTGSTILLPVIAGKVPSNLGIASMNLILPSDKALVVSIKNPHSTLGSNVYFNPVNNLIWIENKDLKPINVTEGEKLFDIEIQVLAKPKETVSIAFSNIKGFDLQSKALTLTGNTASIEVLGYNISGKVTNELDGNPVEGADVILKSANNMIVAKTKADGTYLLEGVYPESGIIITVEKQGIDLTKIDLSDVVIYRQHQMGIKVFTKPADYLKAKAITGNIDGGSLLELKSVILGLTTEFPSGKSWIATPANYTLTIPDVENNIYKTALVIDNLNSDLTAQDFILYQIGQFTNDVVTMKKKGAVSNNLFTIGNVVDLGNGIIGLPIIATSNYFDVAGFQTEFMLQSPMGNYKIQSAGLTFEDKDYFIEQNKVRFLKDNPQNKTFNSGDVLFYITTTDATDFIGDMVLNTGNYAAFSLNSSLQRQVFVTETGSVTGIEEFVKSSCNVFPNPASECVNINTGNLQNVKVSILNISGQNVGIEIPNGNTMNIPLNGLNSGIYFIRIQSGNIVEHHKLIINK